MPGFSVKVGKYSILNFKSDGGDDGDQRAPVFTHNFLLSATQPPVEGDH